MKLFNAVAGNSRYMRTWLDLSERRQNLVLCPLLFSFAYPNSFSDLWSYLDQDNLKLDSLMVDSGAPTVRSQGIYIDREKYGQFIKWVQKNAWVTQVTPVSLDVIARDRSEREKCAKASLENFLYFKEQGINSMPVYHYGEHRKWLDKMLAHSSHIGLGRMQKGSHAEWLDKTWRYLTRQDIKGLRVHGFAQTSFSIIQRYNWYSVDSATPVIAAANGRVCFPKFNTDGTYDYSDSFSLPAGNKTSAVHAAHLKGHMKEAISRYLNSIGFRYQDLFDHYKRIAINVRLFMNFVEEG